MKRISLALLFVFVFFSCKKEKDNSQPVTAESSLEIKFRFEVDDVPLTFNSLVYVNEAGNQYSVNTIVFYLSQISLMREDSTYVPLKDYVYVDASSTGTLEFTAHSIPEGCYTGLSFNIGIDSAHNVPGGLAATPENLAMEWPVPMGGGYHFLRLEGYFADSSGTPGFAMHLGTNACLCKIQLPLSLCLSGQTSTKTLVMNVNEWFRNPAVFDFNIDGNYIMGNAAAMQKLSANGIDVFTVE